MTTTRTVSLLFLIALTAASVTLAEQSSRPLTIVAFGDSTTAVRRTVEQVYADRLPQLLAAQGIGAKVINAGVGGSHTGRLTDNSRHRRAHAIDRIDPNDTGHEFVAKLLAAEISILVRSRRPNIVLVVADDLGYSDLGCYGSEIRTPNLDRLAGNGLQFSQFYNATRCCPSRACLLTGEFPHQVGMGHMPYDAGEPGYRGDLRRDAPTIAELLKRAGYFTAMAGKWHVTRHTRADSPRDNWPTQRGFDEFFGTLPGHGSFWDPAGLMRNNRPIKAERDFFYTDAIAKHAVEFIEQAADRPFFLYAAFTAPHYPLHARQGTIASYEGVYEVGWDVIRSRRHAALIERGLVPKGTGLAPRDPASIPWDEDPNQKWQAHRMQVYAGMITEMDAAIGRIVHKLEQGGKLENTLFVFVSDNGGSNEGHLNNTIERMKKPWKSSVIPKTTPDGKPVRPGDWPGVPLGGPETYGSYGPRWANVSNTPFRRHKSWTHEGGISTPCIIHWPEVIETKQTTHAMAHLVDLMPTFAAVAGIRDRQSAGMNLLPLLRNRHDASAFADREIGWEHEGNRAYRKGKWKIVSEFPGTWTTMYPYPKKGQWELYDVQADRTELIDLSRINHDVLTAMITSYEAWAKRIGAVPWGELEGKQE